MVNLSKSSLEYSTDAVIKITGSTMKKKIRDSIQPLLEAERHGTHFKGYSRVPNNRRGWNNRGVGHCNNY